MLKCARYLCPWAYFAILILVPLFWLRLGYYYFSGPINAPQADGSLMRDVNWDAVNGNFYYFMAAFVLSMTVAVWLAIRLINSLINDRSIVKTKDRLLIEIPACTDEEIVELNAHLGISVSADEALIPLEILNTASVDALAKDIGWLLYLNYADIENLIRRGGYTALHSLADLLLDNWQEESIDEFIKALAGEKYYISRALDAAKRRRSLERQVERLQQEIETCRQEEVSVTDALSASRSLNSDFSHYREISAGKSAATKWLKRMAGRLLAKLHL